ncbi:hypothetical protein G6F35_018786 [Rhizopus arrhizus]|nr:hypothetical protein G6F35_018786 [Rhizopus arrhizus]
MQGATICTPGTAATAHIDRIAPTAPIPPGLAVHIAPTPHHQRPIHLHPAPTQHLPVRQAAVEVEAAQVPIRGKAFSPRAGPRLLQPTI